MGISMKTRVAWVRIVSNESEVCGHFGSSAEVVRDTSALMPNWSGHFGPKTLVPKCLDTEVSGNHLYCFRLNLLRYISTFIPSKYYTITIIYYTILNITKYCFQAPVVTIRPICVYWNSEWRYIKKSAPSLAPSHAIENTQEIHMQHINHFSTYFMNGSILFVIYYSPTFRYWTFSSAIINIHRGPI